MDPRGVGFSAFLLLLVVRMEWWLLLWGTGSQKSKIQIHFKWVNFICELYLNEDIFKIWNRKSWKISPHILRFLIPTVRLKPELWEAVHPFPLLPTINSCIFTESTLSELLHEWVYLSYWRHGNVTATHSLIPRHLVISIFFSVQGSYSGAPGKLYEHKSRKYYLKRYLGTFIWGWESLKRRIFSEVLSPRLWSS